MTVLVTIFVFIKKSSSPIGDGNKARNFGSGFFEWFIKKSSSPIGDGNSAFSCIIALCSIKKSSSPIGDGNDESNIYIDLDYMY